jgi:serine protease
MKNFLLLSVLLLSFNVRSQEVFKDYRDGEAYVKLKTGSLKELLKENTHSIPLQKSKWLEALISRYGIYQIQRPFYQASDDAVLPWVLKLKFTKTEKILALLTDLQELKVVEYAEKVPLLKTDALPNDPVFPSHLNQINAQNAWNVFNGGSNITVAIVDNAVMWTHSDLVTNTYTNTAETPGNSTDDDGNGYIDDVNGYDVADLDNNAVPTNTAMDHGSHCAGIAGAATNNSLGIASIGWNIKIIPVKCAYNNSGTSAVDAGYEGIIYAAKAKARVISCSWGGSGAAAIEQSVIDYAWNKGCIVIASAGNANTNVQSYPGAYNHVYCVASVSSSDIKSSFSNYGSWVDISAPGENIYSTVPSVSTGTYGFKSGTSMATPLVAGLAGLMLSKCAWMSSTDVLNCISSTAVNIYTLGSNSTYSTGNQLGAGRIEAFQAMNCANSFLSIPPVANFFAFPLVSCPSAPIQFYDSSLYAPTGYTWTFQGGSPATSNSSSPSVQWASSGTYSVMLSVSNGNGSNTKTKLSYISITGPQALPLVEGFESLPFLPPNWTPKNVNYDNVYWQRHTGNGAYGTSTACAKFDNYNYVSFGDRDEMRTPRYNFGNVASAHLRYDVAYARIDNTYSDTLEVKMSVNCGTTWSVVSIKGGTTLATRSDYGSLFVPTNAQWRTDTFDISASTAGQNNVMFSFVNHGQYGQPIYLDNINLFFPTPTVNINPITSACVNTSISPVNTSTGAASYTWNFPGGTPAVSTLSNASVTYTAPGIYTIQLIGVNGTSSASISRTLNVNAYPILSVNNTTLCNGSAAVFTLTGASAYTFNPGAFNTSVVTVFPNSSSVYTITGSNAGCISVTNATAFVNPTPTLSAFSPTSCTGSSAIFTLSGASSYTTNPGALSGSLVSVSPTVTSIYTITGSNGLCTSQITNTVWINPLPNLSVNSASICYGNSVALIATGALTYTWSTGANSNSILVSPLNSTLYTVSGSSLNCVKTQTSVVNVNPAFTVSAVSASNSVCSGVTCVLSASGANSYSWSTGSGAQTTSVNPVSSSTYSVIGTVNSCTQSAVVNITVIATPNLSVGISPSNSICIGSSATLNAIGAYNNFTWTQPMLSGSMIIVSPTLTTSYSLSASNSGNGCTNSTVVSLQVNNPAASLTTGSVSCAGSCNGSLNAQFSGGNAPFSFTVLPGTCNSLPCTSLCAGNYQMQIKDGIGCTLTKTFVVNSPQALSSASINISNASCATCANGSIQVIPAGGTPPYTYTWIPSGGNNSSIVDQSPGCYTVMISDANLCSISASACISFGTGFVQFSLNLPDPNIFPNPAEDKLNLNWKGFEFDCLLFNHLGQLLLSSKNVQDEISFDVHNFAKGIYYVELQSGKGNFRKKILID